MQIYANKRAAILKFEAWNTADRKLASLGHASPACLIYDYPTWTGMSQVCDLPVDKLKLILVHGRHYMHSIPYRWYLPLVPSVSLTFKPLEVKSSSLSSPQVSRTLDVIYVTLAVSSVMLTYVCPSSRNDVPPLSVLFPSARITFAIALFFLVFPAKSGALQLAANSIGPALEPM